MTLRIRAKLVLISMGTIALSVLTLYLYLSHTLEQNLADRIRSDLFVRLRLIERTAATAALPWEDQVGWDALADALGQQAQLRVTIIRQDGSVVGDSELSSGQLDSAENHADRQEVRAALAAGRGASTRASATLNKRMMYVALPISDGAGSGGVVRLAMPLTDIDQLLGRVRWILLVAALLAMAVATLMTGVAAHLASRPLRQLTEAARRMARGDMSICTHIPGGDEVAELGQTMDQLASNLSATLGELRGERDLLSRILHSKQEGVLVADGHGRIVMVNQALRAMLLLPPDIVGEPIGEVLHDSRLLELLGRAQREGPGGGEPAPVSAELQLTGLKPRRLIVRAAALAGEPGSVVGVFIDVTNIRRLESMRRDFVANASHELRTPVAAIRSAGETLEQGALADPAAAARFLEIINRNAARLQNLVEDLLDLSRIESREFHLDLQPTDSGVVVQRVCSNFREVAERKNIRLSEAIDPALPALQGDRRALEQILTNLVDNAVKYCFEGATLTVRAQAQGRQVTIAVQDTGPGIEAEHLPRLFERFYRVDTGRSRDLGGTGLGLSIVKHLTEAMAGNIEVQSEPGRGTTFTLHLPVAAGAGGAI